KVSAQEAFGAANDLFKTGRYTYAMFFLHLAAEKMIKALYVNRNAAEPPFGHNLQNLAVKIDGITVSATTLGLLAQITTFNTAARYDDHKKSFQKLCTKDFAKNYLKQGKELMAWLASQFK
ncbi:MAG TPA: HEPN domain-containing protein, partial [bacterium]|nr:HEPN domain-containing protein [bacterium]